MAQERDFPECSLFFRAMPVVPAPGSSPDSIIQHQADQSSTLGAEQAAPQEDRNSFVRASAKNPKDAVSELKKVAQDLRQQKVRLTKDLKNARRRNSRMKNRAKTLTDDELWSVLRMRSATRDERLMRAKSRGSDSSMPGPRAQISGASASASELCVHARDSAVPAALPAVPEDGGDQPALDRPSPATLCIHAMCTWLGHGMDWLICKHPRHGTTH